MNAADYILVLVVLPVLMALSGIVSGSESALFGLTQADRLALRKRSHTALAAAEALLSRPRSLLTAILLANNLVNVCYFSVASVVILGLERRGEHVLAGTLGVATLLAIVLFGEVIAKTTASANRAVFCLFVAPVWLFLIRVLWPLWSGIDRYVMAPLTRLVVSHAHTESAMDPADLGYLLSSGADRSSIDPDEQRLLLDVFRLSSLRARDIMVPRVELDTVALTATADEIRRVIRESQADQLLVLSHDDEPLGFLSARRYLAGSGREAGPFVEKPLFVPEQARLDGLLGQLREQGRDRAVVVDERGELVGIVRVEDVVGELLGEASDPGEAGQVQMLGLGRFRAPGRMSASTLLHDFDPGSARLEGLLGRVSTVGGVVLALLGRVPEVGDAVTLGRLRLTVAELEGRSIEWVEIELLPETATDEGKKP